MPLKKPLSRKELKLFFQIASPCLREKRENKEIKEWAYEGLINRYKKNKLTVEDFEIFKNAYPGVLSAITSQSKIKRWFKGEDPVIKYFFRVHPKNLQHDKAVATKKMKEFCTPRPGKVVSYGKEPGTYIVKIEADKKPITVRASEGVINPVELRKDRLVFIHQGEIVSTPNVFTFKKALQEYKKYLKDREKIRLEELKRYLHKA